MNTHFAANIVAPVISLSPLGPVFGVLVSVSDVPAAPFVVYVTLLAAENGTDPVSLQDPVASVDPLSVALATLDLKPLTAAVAPMISLAEARPDCQTKSSNRIVMALLPFAFPITAAVGTVADVLMFVPL